MVKNCDRGSRPTPNTAVEYIYIYLFLTIFWYTARNKINFGFCVVLVCT